MEGRDFTLLPDFPVRPILCDNNLSALPAEYQDHIIARYQAAGVPLLDANSGFEPRTFDDEVYARWRVINRGPWRFAFDDQPGARRRRARDDMLRDEPPKRKRVYVLIGNEPFDACMGRIREVIEWGGEPHVQPYIKLNALEKRRTSASTGPSRSCATWRAGPRSSWVDNADLERFTVDTGNVSILINPALATEAQDFSTQAERALAAAEAALAAWTPTMRSYTIGGRSMTFALSADILPIISYWKIAVQREQRSKKLSQGLADPRKLQVRLGRG
jgi:hypothetical protein